jgi:L-lactate dehydrogenase complex protein LldG
MSTARDEILQRIRSANHAAGVDDSAIEVPEFAAPSHAGADLINLFVERVADYQAEVTVVDADAVAEEVARALDGYADVVIPDGLPGEWLDGVTAMQLSDDDFTATALDRIDAVVTSAAVGIAVPGTIVLDHGPGQGRRALSLVPDVHLCVIRADQIVYDVPEAVVALEDSARAGHPLTWISGPSATSDIELSRVEGVHGPRTLRVIVVR